MAKIGLLFSGQGSQYEKMGLDLYENFDVVKNTYNKASEIFGFDVIKESISGENFSKTGYSQPCVFTLSLSILQLLKSSEKFSYDGVSGFSLGECCALYGAGMVGFDDVIKIVNYRSAAMQKASEDGRGAMLAVIGLSAEQIEEELKKLDGFCVPVNYNCPGQIVIAGDASAIGAAEIILKEKGAKMCVRLAVSSAFHTKYMDDAAGELKNKIGDIKFSSPKNIDFYTNITGAKVTSVDSLSQHLAAQMTSPVKFQAQIESMIADGYDEFVEIGPGKALSGFVKRINRAVKISNIEKLEQI